MSKNTVRLLAANIVVFSTAVAGLLKNDWPLLVGGLLLIGLAVWAYTKAWRAGRKK